MLPFLGAMLPRRGILVRRRKDPRRLAGHVPSRRAGRPSRRCSAAANGSRSSPLRRRSRARRRCHAAVRCFQRVRFAGPCGAGPLVQRDTFTPLVRKVGSALLLSPRYVYEWSTDSTPVS